MNAAQARAFSQELSKIAVAPAILSKLWRSGLGRAGAGAAVGAGTGALADPENRMRGALLGGAGGAALGYASPLVTSAGRKRALEATKNFGKAQWHGVTGRGRMPIPKGAATKERAAMAKAHKTGITSVPGMVKGLFGKDRKEVLREAWRQSGRAGKLMGAADVAMTIPHVMDPNTRAGAGEKTLEGIGSAGGYLMSSRMPLLGSALFAAGTGTVGKYLGRGVDKIRGYKPPKKAKDQDRLPGLGPKAQYLAKEAPGVRRLIGQ